jgi:AcrR family transcriptional regulator
MFVSSRLRLVSASEFPVVPRLPSRAAGSQRHRPRARTLSRAAIVDAALRIIDAEGLDAMTMRTVAHSLGTGAASLYAHVTGKEELLEAVIDRVLGEIEYPGEPDPAHWQDQLKQMARSIRSVFARHRDLARASFARIPVGESALRGSEWIISLLRGAGLADPVIAFACDLLPLYVMAVTYEDALYAGEEISTDELMEYIDDLRRYFSSLPADRFPGVVSMAAALTAGEHDERFEFGLEVLVRGLAAMPR